MLDLDPVALIEAPTRRLAAKAAGDDPRPAGLLNGLTPIASYGGGDATALVEDLRALANAVAPVRGAPVLVMHPARAVAVEAKAPGQSMRILRSAQVAADTVVAVVPFGLAAALGGLEIETSKQPTVHMSTVPLELVDDTTTVADPVRGMWQTGSVALRMLLDVSWTPRHPAAVAVVTGCGW